MSKRLAHISLGSRRVITMYAEPGNFSALAAQMDASTLKRKAVRLVVPTLARARTTALGRRQQNSYQEFDDFSSPLLRVAAAQTIDIESIGLIWPAGDRIHRCYAVGLDPERRPRLFCKMSINPSLDDLPFRREGEMLRRFSKLPLPDWRTPQFYDLETSNSMLALTVEALPGRRRNLVPGVILKSLPIKTEEHPHDMRIASELSWFNDAMIRPELSHNVRDAIDGMAEEKIAIGLVNGDIRVSNAIITRDDRWLVDWEFSCWEGPLHGDVVTAELNRMTSTRRVLSAESLKQALFRSCGDMGISRNAIALSLLYLVSVDHPWAIRLVAAAWSKSIEMYWENDAGRVQNETNVSRRIRK